MTISEDLTIVDANGVPRIILEVFRGSPRIVLLDERGCQRLHLFYRHDKEHNGGKAGTGIQLQGADGAPHVSINATEDYGALSITYQNNHPGITIATYKDAEVPTIEVSDHKGDIVTLADVETELVYPDDEPDEVEG